MKKKVLEGWVTVTQREERLTSYAGDNFILYGRKNKAECWRNYEDEVVKVKVTIEPA